MAKAKPISNYGGGTYNPKMPPCYTAGELVAVLADLPQDLPIAGSFNGGVKPVWFNVGLADEHLAIEENDGTWDE